MRVQCIYSSYKDVVPPLDPERYSYISELYLIRAKEYVVYGLSVLKGDGKILYYIIDETGRPRSYISDLFDIVDSRFTIADWHFGLGTEQHTVSFIFGYEEFVKTRLHFEGVILQETEDLERFWKWKEIIDKQDTHPEEEWEMVKTDIDGVDITFKRNRRTGEYDDFKFV